MDQCIALQGVTSLTKVPYEASDGSKYENTGL